MPKASSMSYGKKRRGKTTYSNLGFNGQPNVGYTSISQEDWDRVFPPKEKEECQSKQD